VIEPLPSGQAARRWSDLLQEVIDRIESSSDRLLIEPGGQEANGRQAQLGQPSPGDWREAIARWAQEPRDSVSRWARRWSSHAPDPLKKTPPAAARSSSGDSTPSPPSVALEMAQSWLAAGGPRPLGQIWCQVAQQGPWSVPLLKSQVAWLKLLAQQQDRPTARPWRLSLGMVAAIWIVALFLIEYHGGILHAIAMREHLEDQPIPLAMEQVRQAIPIVATCLLVSFVLLGWLWRRWLSGRRHDAWRTHAQWLFAQQLFQHHVSVPEAVAIARQSIAMRNDHRRRSDAVQLPTDALGLHHAVRWSEIGLRYRRDRWQAAGHVFSWLLGLLGIATAIAAASLPWVVMIREVMRQLIPGIDSGSIPTGGGP
jgi:hypothetical protein